MDKKQMARDLGTYPRGVAVYLTWDRGNGDLERNYVYLGNNFFDGVPMLLDYENFEKNVATFFDFSNPEIIIKDFAVSTYNSLEGLINLD